MAPQRGWRPHGSHLGSRAVTCRRPKVLLAPNPLALSLRARPALPRSRHAAWSSCWAGDYAPGNFRALYLLPLRSVDAPPLTFVHSIPTNSVGIEDRYLTTSIAPIEVTPAAGHAAAAHRPSFHGTGAVAFSTKGEYGVRLMVQLGRHYGTGPASLNEIATEDDLPRAYLEQLAFVLRDAGLVESTRGAHGGYTLPPPPAEKPMTEILPAVEGPPPPTISATDVPATGTSFDRPSTCPVNFLGVRVPEPITLGRY